MREQGILPRKHQIVVRSKKGGGGEEEEGDRGEIFFPLGLFSASSAGDDVSLSECQEQSKQSKALKASIATVAFLFVSQQQQRQASFLSRPQNCRLRAF